MPISLYSGPLSPVNEHYVEMAKSFAGEHLKPHAERWEQTKCQPEEKLRMAIAQFAAIRIPKNLGGKGESAATIARVYEELAKKFATRAAFDGLNTAMQVMGANGLLRDNPLARQMSGARVTDYMDGTTEIQNMVIGRSLTG